MGPEQQYEKIVFLEMSSSETRPSLFSLWVKTVTVTRKKAFTDTCVQTHTPTHTHVLWGFQTVTAGRLLYAVGDNRRDLFLRRRRRHIWLQCGSDPTAACLTLGLHEWIKGGSPVRWWWHSLTNKWLNRQSRSLDDIPSPHKTCRQRQEMVSGLGDSCKRQI